ncbi:MAG TPA: adenylate/guanylate cyclase domain-containing protein, partial [Chloroflexota bacterium]
MTDAAPSGPTIPETAEVRTFLIADVRGYTSFTVEHGDEGAAQLAARFADIVEEIVTARDGRVIELRGDEALAVFSSARGALRTAVDLQRRFTAESAGPTPFEVGIGLDAGEAIPVKEGFRGAALNLAARLCSLAGPGEVLASEALIHLARKIDGLEYAERGSAQLKGFAEPVQVIQVMESGQSTRPPASVSPYGGEIDAEPESGEGAPQHLPIGGFLGSLPSGSLVARDEDLRRILLAVDAVIGGEGRLLMLGGEAGVGKTRLAQELTLTARNRGFLIAAGSCYEPESGTPFYPFLEALAAAYTAAPAAIRSAAPQRWPYLAKLLPA